MRFRATICATVEYDINPADYPAGSDLGGMLLIDSSAILSDPVAFLRTHDEMGNAAFGVSIIEVENAE